MTNVIQQTFGTSRVLLPVIHPVDRDTALRSIETAITAGAHGVFLINQGMDEAGVLRLAREVTGRFPDLWLGINLLGLDPAGALPRLARNVGGLWSDDAGIDEGSDSPASLERFVATRGGWPGLFFGGVAFKYRRAVDPLDIPAQARRARDGVDVVTTSGDGTGIAAPTAKLAAFREALGDHALALASGITPENVRCYLPFVDAYLVATGIESSWGVLDPQRTKALADAVRAFAAGAPRPT